MRKKDRDAIRFAFRPVQSPTDSMFVRRDDDMTRAEQQPVGLAVTQSSSHRRRWLRIAVVAVIAAAIGITLANDWFPRLNTAEKRIVGEWTFADLAGRPISHHVRFARDRTFFLWSSDHTTERGTWK